MNSSNHTVQLQSCSFRLSDVGMPEWRSDLLTVKMSATLLSLTVINLLVSLCATLLNILVIVAVKTTPSLRNEYNALLACLAGTDLMTALLGQPVFIADQIYRLTKDHNFASKFCGLRFITSGTFAIASIHHLTLISIERYFAIKYPFQYPDVITKSRFVVAVLVAWSLSVFPSLFSIRMNSSVFFVIFRVLSLLVNTSVLIFCHAAVYHETRKQIQKIKAQQVSAEAKEKFLRENKALKTTVLVIGAFVATCTPIILVRSVLKSRISSLVVLFALEAAFESLALCNSICNPLIYCVRSRDYRRAFKKLLRFKQNAVYPGSVRHMNGEVQGNILDGFGVLNVM